MSGFTKPMVEALTKSTDRPVIFALSNPKSQAEITAQDAYHWSEGGQPLCQLPDTKLLSCEMCRKGDLWVWHLVPWKDFMI